MNQQTPEEVLARWEAFTCKCDISVGFVCEACHDSKVLRGLIKERNHLRDVNYRAMAIIKNAVMHGMSVTKEVADVRDAMAIYHAESQVTSTGYHDDDKSYGISCNYSGCEDIKPGSKCFITWLNPRDGGKQVQVWTKSRKLKFILKVVSIEKLSNFRCAWIPLHVRCNKHRLGAPWSEKSAAVALAAMFNEATKAMGEQS